MVGPVLTPIRTTSGQNPTRFARSTEVAGVVTPPYDVNEQDMH